jgi:hypothetical protein
MNTFWRQIQQRWPANWGDSVLEYQFVRTKAAELLKSYSIDTVGFSHYGVIVNSIEQALNEVTVLSKASLPEVTAAWVEAYQVHVARLPLEGVELEFIAPVGRSFFADHQQAFGDGLHHISFQVADVAWAINTLAANGEQLLDPEPRSGSHGKVAFTAPEILSPLRLELFQSTADH